MLKPDFDPLSDVEIVNFAPTRVAALRHWDDPAHIGNSICRLIDWCQRNHLPPHKNTTFTIVHATPQPPQKTGLIIDLCIATTMAIPDNPYGIFEHVIPANRCARLRHIGPDHMLKQAVAPLYADWMPQAGEAPGNYPLFLQRISFASEVPSSQAITDIYIPLAP